MYVIMSITNSVLDDVNLKIIDILGKDSSTPFVEIAKQIGVSDATGTYQGQKIDL